MHVCFAHSHKPRINIYELGGSVFKKSELFGPSQLRISMHSRKKGSTVPKWSHLESSVVYRNKLRELFNTCPPKRPFFFLFRETPIPSTAPNTIVVAVSDINSPDSTRGFNYESNILLLAL